MNPTPYRTRPWNWRRERLEKKGERKKRQIFESLRRRVERDMAFWVGHRWGDEHILHRESSEFERLERCETGGDFLRFYLETADLLYPKPGWFELSMRDRWHTFRSWATPCYDNGELKPDGERGTSNRKEAMNIPMPMAPAWTRLNEALATAKS
jgi:hypothetical protein